MRPPHELSWTTVLLSCVVTSVATSLVLAAVSQQRPSRSKSSLETTTKSPQTSSSINKSPKPVVDLQSLSPEDVPRELRVDAYFAPERIRTFGHQAVFDHCTNVFAVIDAIHPHLLQFFNEKPWITVNSNVTILKTSGKRDRDGYYTESDDANDTLKTTSSRRWRLRECIDPSQTTEVVLFPGVDPQTFTPDKIVHLDPNVPSSSGRLDEAVPKKCIVVLPGALVLGGVFDVSEGSIYIGRHVRIEPHVVIKGPCVLGDYTTVRSGAYLRGDVIVGRHVVLRGELKNALIMDHAELCHPGYCGDSICGYKSHFGNQVTTANLTLFSTSEILVEVGDKRYKTGRKKIGVVLGDHAQLGCSTVTDPCTLVRPNTIVYALTRLSKGIYGPNVIVKNKPLEKGVLEISPLEQQA